MAVLDGKYEILSQRAVGEGQMQFDAVAPDGAALRIIWYDLDSSEQAQQFERYRRLLRRLRKGGFAALHDVVSRPGAHYIAWYTPETSQWGKPSTELLGLLESHAYTAASADIRQTETGKALVYDLAFDPEEPLVPEVANQAVEDTLKPRARSWNLRGRSASSLAWGISVLLTLVSLVLLLVSFRASVNTGFVTVPSLLGLDVNEASVILKRLDLNVSTAAVPSAEPLGTVLGVSPPPGSALKRYYPVVRLSYAVPADQLALVAVPDLNGLTVAGAEELINEAGLELGRAAYTTSGQDVGTVIAQSRTPTAQVSEGTKVDILISEGEASALTFVPDLVGLSVDDARFLLGISGLRYELNTLEQPGYPPGVVIEQTIAPYKTVDIENAAIRIYVSEGEAGDLAGAVTPSFIGLSAEEAGRLARNYTLTVRELDSPDLPAGVVTQNPAPGSAVTGELELTFNVYTPPVAIPVPAVEALVREPEERRLSYAWNIESGIRESLYTVRVTTAQGDSYPVKQGVTRGGETVTGSFTTRLVGPIEFELFLQNQPYSVPIRRN